MKLKKIASLMLAGIMAVSMLAGCKGNTISEQPNEQPEEPTTSGYSAVFEDAMDPDDIADGKITMSDNADLTARLNKAIGNLSADTIDDFYNGNATNGQAVLHFAAGGRGYADLRVIADLMDTESETQAFSNANDMLANVTTDVTTAKTVTLLYAANSAVDPNEAVEQIARLLDERIGDLPINNDGQQNGTTESVHFVYTGSVSVASKTLASDHGMGMHLIAVEITRTARG